MRLISRNEVLTIFSRPTLFRNERAGEFSMAVQISANRVSDDEKLVDAWSQEKLAQQQLLNTHKEKPNLVERSGEFLPANRRSVGRYD